MLRRFRLKSPIATKSRMVLFSTCVLFVVRILPMFFVSPAFAAQGPGVDPLQRDQDVTGKVDFTVTLSARPTSSREIVALGGLPAELVRTRVDGGYDVTLTYHATEETAWTAAWGSRFARDVRRWSAPSGGGTKIFESADSRRLYGGLGMEYALRPKSRWDPRVSAFWTSEGTTRLSLSVTRITDPVVSSAKLTLIQARPPVKVSGGSKAMSAEALGSVALRGNLGFVANDKVSLTLGLGIEAPISRHDLTALLATLRWRWTRDPATRSTIGLVVDMRHSDDELGVTFGVEWGGRLSDD